MSNESSDNDTDVDVRIEILKKKYLEKRSQVSSNPETFGLTSNDHELYDAVSGAGRSKKTSKSHCVRREMRDYDKALKELFRTLSDQPQRYERDRSDEDLGDEEDCPEETNIFCTETDVTLPSNLARSPSSCVSGSVLNGRQKDFIQQTQSLTSGPAAAVHVYQEMLQIYEKLQAERLSQQEWAAELCEREHQLQQRENALLQHQSTIQKLRGVEGEVLKHIQSLQQQYQEETNQLRDALKQKSRENKRMKSSFDSIKELNDSMKKQLNEVSEQNKRLESQSRKVQSRLENLQRKYEYSMAHKSRENVVPKAHDPKPCKQEKPLSNKVSKGAVHGTTVKLVAALLDWVVDGRLINPREEENLRGCELYGAPCPSLHERCSKVLPMLVEQLQQAAVLEPSLQLSLLRFIYCCLLQLERSTQHAPLTSTLRRLGEEVSRGLGDPGNTCRSRAYPLFKSPCLHTRFLSSLIILKTINQADILAQALDVLYCDVRTEEGQAFFLQYQGLLVILALLRGGSPGLLNLSMDILLQMSAESRVLPGFLEECSTEEFFRCASLFLRNPRLELALVEKMTILLQKLSSIRKNKRLFEAFSLHLLLQEMHRTADPAQAFLSLNLSSILLNLGMLMRS